MALLGILKHYLDPASPPSADVEDHFDQVARSAPPADVGRGIAAAFRSGSTPSFADSVGSLFDLSNPQQRAGVLNELVRALPPGALANVAGGVLGGLLGGANPVTAPPLTPAEASQVSSAQAATIAGQAEAHSGTVVDAVAAFYAQHPDLVKSMGAAALAIALGHMRSNT